LYFFACTTRIAASRIEKFGEVENTLHENENTIVSIITYHSSTISIPFLSLVALLYAVTMAEIVDHDSLERPREPQSTNVAVGTEPLPKFYPKFRGKPLYNGNKEALGWALDSIARAVQFIGAGAFLGTALIRIAKEAAGCPTEPPEGETLVPECDKKVYGIKPSSLLTTYTMIVGIASACLLPLMGAIIDYTPYRLQVGRILSALFTVLILPTIFLNEDNFFAIAIIQVIISFIGWAQTAISYAYLPELTTNELLLNDYTKSFTMLSYGTMVVFLGVVIGGLQATGNGDDDLLTNQVAMSIAFAIGVCLLGYAWGFLFGRRDRMHQLPSDQKRIWTAGFVQLYNTGKHITLNYRALKWFYLSIAMSDAALQALATIAITYLTDQLQFTAQENGIATGCMLLGCVPGGMLANFATKSLDPIKSSMVALIVLILTTAAFAYFLKGPGQHVLTYILAFIWGTGTGWKWTCDRLVASCVIPEGQDAELMGFYLFSGQSLTWIPPLVFTAVNESGVSQRVGVATLDGFFVIGFVCYLFMGGYVRARTEVGRNTTFIQEAKEAGGQTNAGNAIAPLEQPGKKNAEVEMALPMSHEKESCTQITQL
jgi:MFS-type transporter involved in bile tolerance (Atg22 family)